MSPPDPVIACAYNPRCSPETLVKAIKDSKDSGLGGVVFSAIEGADVEGRLDGNWSGKGMEAAAKGGASLEAAITNAFGGNLDKAQVKQLSALAKQVAGKLKGHGELFESIDHEKSFLDRVLDVAKVVVGPVVNALATIGCFALVGAAATATAGAAAVVGAGCSAVGGMAGRFVGTWVNTGSVGAAFDSATDPGAIALDAAIGGAIGGATALRSARAASAAESAAASGGRSSTALGETLETAETSGTQRVVDPSRLGPAGESSSSSATGMPKNTRRIPSASGKAEFRVPDHMDSIGRYIGETKNVAYQPLSSQLLDDASYVTRGGVPGRVDVFVDTRTVVSRPLLRAHLDPGNPINLVVMRLNG